MSAIRHAPGKCLYPRLAAAVGLCLGALPPNAMSAGQAITRLAPITVTATLSEQDARTAPASVTIIDREELDRRAPPTLLEAVRGVPGFTLSPRQVGGRKTFALRGLEGKHVLVLIDGRRIAPTDDVVGHSDYQYGWVPMESVERIEIVRGPMSTLYGSEALGGVINVITQRPQGDWRGALDLRSLQLLEGDGGDGHRATFAVSGGVGERVGLRLEAEDSRVAPVPYKEDKRYVDQEGNDVRTLGVSGRVDLTPQQALEFGLRYGEEERWYGDVTSAGLSYVSSYDLDRSQGHLGWRGNFGRWNAELRGYRSRIEITNRRTQGVAPTRPQELIDTVIDGHATATAGQHRLTLGFEAREEYLRNAGLTYGDDEADHRALFVQDEFAIGQHLIATAGVRVDHHEFFGDETSPRVYLVYAPGDGWVFKAGYGHAFKAPTLKQVSPDYVGAEGPHTFMGNAGIVPESADAFELAVDWLRGPVNLRAAVFETRVEDLITYNLLQQIGIRRIYQYDNVNRARIRGLEGGGSVELGAGFRLKADLTLLDTEDRDTGRELNYRPEHSLSAYLDWNRGAWTARVGAERIGDQRATDIVIPAYTLWNASAGLRLGQRMNVQLGFDNLTNERLDGEPVDYGYAERGRSATLSVGMEF